MRGLGKIEEKVLAENLFLFAWSLMVIHMYVTYSSLSAYSNSFVSLIAFVAFCFKILSTKYTARELAICSFLLIVGILTIQPAQDMRVFWFAITVFALKNVDTERVIKVTYSITLVCCALFLCSYLLKFSVDEIIYIDDGNIRHGFGFGHPNTLQAYILYIVSMAMYVNYTKMKRWILIFFLLVSFIVYSFTYSRTGIIVTTIVLIMAWLIRFSPISNLMNYGLIAIAYTYITIFSVLPIIYYRYMNPIFNMLNGLLTNRISQAAYFYGEYGVKLFGFRPIELTYEKRYIYLDMGYETMLICQGLIYFVIVVGTMVILLYRYTKEKNQKRLLLLFAFALFLGTENVATYIFLNVSMLFISELIFLPNRRTRYNGRKHLL